MAGHTVQREGLVIVGINGYKMETIDDICRHKVGMDYDQLVNGRG